MVPPGGNTRERNRGRGYLMGSDPITILNIIISLLTFNHKEIAQDFGDLTTINGGECVIKSSSTLVVWVLVVLILSIRFTNIQLILLTIANTANAIDFGD